jgi:D-alanine-D-alanine ligase-like ATP-grasp enzyme
MNISAEHLTKEMDVLLRDDETPEALVAHLNERLAARVVVSPQQYNSALTLLVTGTRAQVAAAFAWLATEGKPRFDLRGKPPVGKGEQR